MGLSVSALEVLSRFPAKQVLSLGYPDILATTEDIERLFKVTPQTFVDTGGWHGRTHDLPETVEFFNMIGSELRCVDVHASRGVEYVVDLNYPNDLGKFDLVIDAGTIEHCFNIGQAIINAANAVNEGGAIFHTPPMSMVNHGFYNISPTLLFDFYMQNGWNVEFCCGSCPRGMYDINPYLRYAVPPESSIFFVARRTNMNPLSFPTQQKYLKNPDLKALN